MSAPEVAADAFPSLSTRSLGVPCILHPGSCCPSMDVCLLSDPPSLASSSSSGSHIRLYRLSGGSTSAAADEAGKSGVAAAFAKARAAAGGPAASGSAQVWQTLIPPTKPPSAAAAKAGQTKPVEQKKDPKGKGKAVQVQPAEAVPEPPAHLPESIAWSPDGQVLAFGSSTSNVKLYSVHDGQPLLKAVRLPPVQSTSTGSNIAHDAEQAASGGGLYFLAWQDLEVSIPKESILAEDLSDALPGLPSLLAIEEVKPKKNNLFANPFMQGGLQKPYVPSETFQLPIFPTLPAVHAASPVQGDIEELDTLHEHDGPDGSSPRSGSKVDSPTLLLAGDEHGRLHLLHGGSISLGSLALGSETDIISAFLCGPPTVTRPKSPLHLQPEYMTTLSLLLSVPLAGAHDANLPSAIFDALEVPPRLLQSKKGRRASTVSEQPEDTAAQAVLRVTVDVPHLPSAELSLLTRAATGIAGVLNHAFGAVDGARQAWEEAQDLGRKWIGRLKDDDDGNSAAAGAKGPELKLLLLLLTGRPANTDMHDYFANKNTERNLERWEAAGLKATLKIRNACYMSLAPVCERLLLWLDQLKGYCLWESRFGSLNLQKRLIDECVPLVEAIMLNAAKLESISLDEELGYRDLIGWLKFELERISGLEAQADSRPTPKHDVLSVMTYLKTKLPANAIDDFVHVHSPSESREKHAQALQEWIDAVLEARELDNVKQEGKEGYERIMQKMRREVDKSERQTANDEDTVDPEDADEAGEDDDGDEEEIVLKADRLFVEPPLWHPPPLPPAPALTASTSRRKSTAAAAPPPAPGPAPDPVNPIELPLPVYLRELTSRLARFFEAAFESATAQAEITSVRKIVTWSPPDREEDNAITALGLARDPTKITSRVVVTADEGGGTAVARHWIACETPAGILGNPPSDTPHAFWIICCDHDGSAYGAPFALQHRKEDTDEDFKILDADFFDDAELALLIRFPGKNGQSASHAIATVKYQTLEQMTPLEGGQVNFAQFSDNSPMPIARLHRFTSDFEPLQFALNGRKGRRIGCILGAQGKVLEVLDMDTDEPDDEAGDEPLDALDEDEEDHIQMEFPDLLGGQGGELEEFEQHHGGLNGIDDRVDDLED